MLRFAGHVLSHQAEADITDEQRVAALEVGHAALVRRVGRDLGYELLPWHALLLSDQKLGGEYQHPYAWQRVRAAVERALTDPARERLLATLRSRARSAD
jgi:hypothetical protein